MAKDKTEILENRKSFVINCEHADMIVNDLLQGDYDALGRIFTDLVNFNLYGDQSLYDKEKIAENPDFDKSERTARRLFKSDSEHYIKHYVARSKQNSKNRTAGQYPDYSELKEYARLKGYDENLAVDWGIQQASREWKDQNGEPVKYWKKTLDAYMKAINRKRIEEMTRTFSR